MESTQTTSPLMVPIGAIINPPIEDREDSQPNYQRTSSQTSQRSTGSLLKRRPLISAGKTPDEIIGAEYSIIKKTLIGWGKARERATWEEYAAKIAPATRDMMAKVFSELRRNGYLNPRVRDDKIIVDYVCIRKDDIMSETLSLCALCERECNRKDWKGIFKSNRDGSEVKRCWDAN